MVRKESYVERFTREQKEKAQKESRKPQKGEKMKGGTRYGADTNEGERQATEETENGQS